MGEETGAGHAAGEAIDTCRYEKLRISDLLGINGLAILVRIVHGEHALHDGSCL